MYINSPKGSGYTRLDSYNPATGEIVSRKFTQFSEIQEQTGINYVNELPAKYPVNGTIANVPSSGPLAGRPLVGQHYLEVPVQARPIPQAVLDAADRAGVIIRSIFFCKSWFRAKKKPTEIWTEERAKAAHVNKQPYTVLVDSLERPYCFLEVSAGVVAVGYLDELLRETLTYAFQEVEPGKLFLSMATHREFEADTDKVARGVTYLFEQGGSLTIRKESFQPHRLETTSSTVDVSANYSAVPEFGEYDDLLRVERS